MRFSSGLAPSSTSPPGSIASRTAATSLLNAVTLATSSRRIGNVVAGAADAGARLIDGVDEVRDHSQLQRIERPARDGEGIERIRQRLAGAQRKQRMPIEKRRPSRWCAACAATTTFGSVDGASSDERRRAKRRQRQRGDGLNDAIELERVWCLHFLMACWPDGHWPEDDGSPTPTILARGSDAVDAGDAGGDGFTGLVRT